MSTLLRASGANQKSLASMRSKHPLTCFRLKFFSTTIFLPVTPSTTLSSLKSDLLSAIESSRDESATDAAEPEVLPKKVGDIALWRGEIMGGGGADSTIKWTQLSNETDGAGKWGLEEADEVGVSFKDADGSFHQPTITRPLDPEFED